MVFDFFVNFSTFFKILSFLLFYVFKLLFKHFWTPGKFWDFFGNSNFFDIFDLEILKNS